MARGNDDVISGEPVGCQRLRLSVVLGYVTKGAPSSRMKPIRSSRAVQKQLVGRQICTVLGQVVGHPQ